jgi:predicted ferric reductase
VDGPYGAFSVDLHPKAAGFVFVAGGVGVAPMMSMLRTLADRGDRRPLVLFYGSARWNDTIFREELADLRTRLDLRVVHALEEPSGDPAHETGYLTEELLRRHLPETARDWPCFLCGPKAMTDSVLPSLRRLGFPLRHLHTELFEMA